MRNKTGGPAFPTPRFTMDGEGRVLGFSISTDGMSLRDYFAAMAMQMEMQGTKKYYDEGECDVGAWADLFVNIADHAYLMADAMLKAREE